MNKLFVLSRYNKKLLFLIIAFIIDVLSVFGLFIFDIIEFVIVSKNSAKLSRSFIPVNIALAILCLTSIILFVILLILKRRKSENGL